MGMNIKSISNHTASNIMPLNSLFPLSVMIFCVADGFFFYILYVYNKVSFTVDYFSQIFIGFYFF